MTVHQLDRIEPSERLPAYRLLADELRTLITSGQLRPGDRLPTEPQLCARSGVSRSTVREALRLLASQHLIVTTRGVTGGSFVARPSPAQLAETLSTGMTLMMETGGIGAAELFEVRETFEVPAAGLAALRRTDEDLVALRSARCDPDREQPIRMPTVHRAFHAALAAATGNPLYSVVIRPLYCPAMHGVPDRPRELWHQVESEHGEILAAVEARDRIRAQDAARAHLATLRRANRAADFLVGAML